MKHDIETILLVARAIAGHSAPDKAQMWEANSALNALAEAGLLRTCSPADARNPCKNDDPGVWCDGCTCWKQARP